MKPVQYCKAFISLLYPQHCLICGIKLDLENNKSLCKDCWGKIKMASPAVFRFNKFGISTLFAACAYEGVLRECVHKLKYNNALALSRPLGDLLCEFAHRQVDFEKIDFLVPMPLHPVKIRERGFNQADLLANIVSGKLGIKILKALKRKKYTKTQAGLNKPERFKNVNDAFVIKKRAMLKQKRILLIDDVFTTGSTAKTCAKMMVKAGAKSVDVLVLARKIR